MPMQAVTDDIRWKDLDLTAALRILEHSGRRDVIRFGLSTTAQMQALIDALCDLSVHDGLTGLVNAAFFRASLAAELDRSARTHRTCGLLLLDLDRFKCVNDDFGHHAGDEVLKAVAVRLKKSLRSMDTAARIGGEEFAVILPECSAEDAVRAATRIHTGLNPITVISGAHTLSVTASAGVVWTEPGTATAMKDLLARADAELYRAKREGRRRLVHPPPVATRVLPGERAAVLKHEREEGKHEG